MQNGTPLMALARAAAMSPWASCVTIPLTPIGAMNSGDCRSMP